MANSEIEAYSGSREIIRREEPLAPVLALETYEEEIRHPKRWIGGDVSRLFSKRGVLATVLGGAGLSTIAGFLTAPYLFLSVPSGLFFGLILTLGLSITVAVKASHGESRAEKKYLERLGAVELVRDSLTREVESWLFETYGLKFASEENRTWFGNSALGISPLRWHDLPFRTVGSIESPKPGLISTLNLMSTQGAKLTADFYLTEDGSFEVRKHTILDTTESPYFTTIREELS